ncbi:MAG: RNA-binding protein [Neisseriaceae bacterium]|jgi:RNA recognition motif-containing protein|nr:MAG: RNA-binding protein [Neisseriaceae bacterium]
MNTKLFVAGLDWAIDTEALKSIFGQYGTVVYGKVVVDDQRRSRGFGFVEMSSHEEAEACLNNLNGSTHGKRAIVVKWKEDKPQ